MSESNRSSGTKSNARGASAATASPSGRSNTGSRSASAAKPSKSARTFGNHSQDDSNGNAPKPAIDPADRPGASGHRFGPDLACSECGIHWDEHQKEPAPCVKDEPATSSPTAAFLRRPPVALAADPTPANDPGTNVPPSAAPVADATNISDVPHSAHPPGPSPSTSPPLSAPAEAVVTGGAGTPAASELGSQLGKGDAEL